MLNPGAWLPLLQAGQVEDFLEAVDYHGKRLAKLDVPPHTVLAAVSSYERGLLLDLKKHAPKDYPEWNSVVERLYFSIKLTLNNAYYEVRDLEARAFYEVLRDQLEALSVDELLHRVLETLMRTFRAHGGVFLLLQPETEQLELRAWKGMTKSLAGCFSTTIGHGLGGKIAEGGKPLVVVDVKQDSLTETPKIRRTLESLWGVPLSVRSKVTGVLLLGFSHEYHCLPRELKLFEAIAERCALAIDKAQLLEELRKREEQIRALGEHMMKVEEEERRRISRELHDEVGQSLLVIRLYLEMVQRDMPGGSEHLGRRLSETQEVAESTIVEMRRLISALSPNVLAELGLTAGIRQFVKNFSRTFPGRVKMRMSNVDKLPETTKIMAYRLVQECFTNAVKHSKAQNVELRLTRRNGRVHVQIEDDGIGFDLKDADKKRDSFGLAGMKERVTLLGGDISVESALGHGTKVAIAIPVLSEDRVPWN